MSGAEMENIMGSFVLQGINGRKEKNSVVKKDTSTTLLNCPLRCHELLCIIFPDIRKK